MSPGVRATVEIVNELGLHTRAATLLVRTAAHFRSEVWLTHQGMRANAKSIMGLLALAARRGSSVEIETRGEDEAEALAAVGDLVRAGFHEGSP